MKNNLASNFEIGSAIDPGEKRKGGPNQDSLVVLKPRRKQALPIILVIADGMGGYQGGQIASQIIISKFKQEYSSESQQEFKFEKFASRVIEKSLVKMQQQAALDTSLENMGSTLVTVCVQEGFISIANVGDSHAYLIHEGQIQQINYDHSFMGEAIRAGLLTKTEAMTHPKRNQLTQSISARRTTIKPFFNKFELFTNDLVVLCSDGLWGVVPETMIQTVATELPPQRAAEKLIKLANSNGGPDNISVIVCRRVDGNPKNPFYDPGKKEENKPRRSLFSRIFPQKKAV